VGVAVGDIVGVAVGVASQHFLKHCSTMIHDKAPAWAWQGAWQWESQWASQWVRISFYSLAVAISTEFVLFCTLSAADSYVIGANRWRRVQAFVVQGAIDPRIKQDRCFHTKTEYLPLTSR
jgi:hypothetical protein